MEFRDTQVKFNIVLAMNHPLERYSTLYSHTMICCNYVELLEQPNLDKAKENLEIEFCVWQGENSCQLSELYALEDEEEVGTKGAIKNIEKSTPDTL